MTDWLGMLAAPRTPRPELKGRVVARALARRRRWGGPLAAAAVITLILGGGAWWAYRTIGRLTAERDGLVTRVQALEDTVSTFIHGPATRLIQIPVSTGGRVGSVTIFADSAVMGLEMPRADQRVMGAAMSIEPRAGSASPSGPMVFHLLL